MNADDEGWKTVKNKYVSKGSRNVEKNMGVSTSNGLNTLDPSSSQVPAQTILKAAKYLEEVGLQEKEFILIRTFSIQRMYRKLRGEFPKCSRRRLICNNYGAPRWVFILYLNLQGRLQIIDRIAKWSQIEDLTCPLCAREPQTTEHLFFKCEMTSQMWERLLEWQGIKKRAQGWSEEVQWAEIHAKGQSAMANMYRLCMAACVYHIWMERNLRIFQGKSRTKEIILRLIAQEVHNRGNQYKKLTRKLQAMKWYPRD
ncbi:uncharacterized protein LOC142173531 [Nicotiana tabacum]|uniref:Uncharacterized protein LOC142173531 n=1 Tax=Nicotiana tabacum TaxID=4097 RepID=A0AC58TDE0_TOBAC